VKRLLFFIIGLLLIPALLFAQVDYSGKGIYNFLTSNYSDTTTSQAYVNSRGFFTSANLSAYALKADYYDSAAVDLLLTAKLDVSAITDYYTKTQADALLLDKASTGSVALKLDASVIANYYTSLQIDALLADKSDTGAVALKADKSYVDSTDETLFASILAVVNDVSSIITNLGTIENRLDSNEALIVDSSYYGFPEGSKPTLSYDASSRTLSIGANYVWCNGVKYYNAATTKDHPDTYGVHYFYYDASGTLTTSQSLWNILNTAQIAFVVYNPAKATAPKGFYFDEKHGVIMDVWTHLYEHILSGAKVSNIFTISDYSLQPASPTTAGNQFSISGGNLYDEDNKHIITPHTDGTAIPILWRDGTDGVWFWSEETVPVIVGTTYLKYNHISGGVWTTTEVSANQYVNMWLCATGAGDSTYQYILITGQHNDSTLAAATARNFYDLSLGTDFFAEVVPIQRITFRTGASYNSAIGQCRIEAVSSLYGTSITLGNIITQMHNALGGRSDAGSHPASAISYTDTSSIGSTDAQSAIDTLAVYLLSLDAFDIPSTLSNVGAELDSLENAINGIIVGSGFATETWVNATVETAIANALASIDFSNYYTKAQADATTEAYAYSKAQTNATIEAAIAAIPTASPNLTISVNADGTVNAGDVVSLLNTGGVITAKTADNTMISGIATTTASTGNPVTVLIKGTATGLSGLTTGANYYRQADYSIGTTPVLINGAYIFIGYGASSTSLILD